MTKIALFGAGGKMGVRSARNLLNTDFDVAHVEISEAGQKRLKDEIGKDCVPAEEALKGAEVVLLAVPDTAIKAVSHAIIDKVDPGAVVICLDAAGPFAGHLPTREDVSYFITHPCHPPIFNDENTPEGRNDHFGGIAAKQGIVNALMQGPDEHYALGEAVGKAIYAPVIRSHRVTVDQMALLEPGLSETVCASLLLVMKDAMDEVVARGVPEAAARDFLLGHMNILAAVTFGHIDGVFSDACYKAIENGTPMLMKDDWKRVFEPEEIAASIQRIT
ncbi:coenzyme F420-dependent NADP oxidoreductase-like protein [Primorskyibacter sedentarius]|uniref:Coenzyme F420-dependent NADP oxidoreductase-like protein n=1 Tax=Primorskyibacter sedentarius TaxID=745311 RepID=A0A4V2UNK7_9RHOB|nr:phosphogluconate dehydrogenase C-terminal domain-containing protein [Primorskyibacter sedentarius]TCS61521.1 coenzyme F420-dependent NADP oxidoreductase-like protein [Primorskyibacter sedentarius]